MLYSYGNGIDKRKGVESFVMVVDECSESSESCLRNQTSLPLL